MNHDELVLEVTRMRRQIDGLIEARSGDIEAGAILEGKVRELAVPMNPAQDYIRAVFDYDEARDAIAQAQDEQFTAPAKFTELEATYLDAFMHFRAASEALRNGPNYVSVTSEHGL